MKLLAIETATLTASAAVVCDGSTLALCERTVDTHSDVLLSLVDEALRSAQLRVAHLDGVAVGAGPGSFTGLRIGMATAKGLCFAADIPLWTVSSLAALALDAGARPSRVVVPVLDAKKGEVFAGVYRVGPDGAPVARTADRVLAPAAMAELLSDLDDPLLLGTGVAAYPREIAPLGELAADVRCTPSAESVARIALTAGETADLATAAPTYVRLSEAELKWRKHIP